MLVGAFVAVATPAMAQVDLAGQWQARTNEDQPHWVPGPDLGHYTERLEGASEDRARTGRPRQHSTTLNIYTHVVDKSHRSAIEAVERGWFPSVPKSENSLERAVPASDSVNREFGGAARI